MIMRSYYLVILLTILPILAKTQNLQMHYDLGKDRKMITSTAEIFKRDSFGSTFMFVDFDYGGKVADVDGISRAYMEVSRELKFWESPIAIHAEFDGGFFRNSKISLPINNSFLLGFSYSLVNKTFTRTFSTQILYKYIKDINDASFQFTIVWGLHFFNRKLSLTGFADFWRQDVKVFDDNGNATEKKFVFVSEPQIWYNFHSHFSVGGEVEISSNFSGHKGFMGNPTLAIKWIF